MALGTLIDHFGRFVRERHDALPASESPLPAFPQALAELHRNFGHHLVLLGLLARSDGDYAPAEAAILVGHGLSLATDRGDATRTALEEYVRSFRPTLVQLDPALRRLAHDPPEQVALFFGAARALIEADGVARPEEARFLEGLEAGLAPAC